LAQGCIWLQFLPALLIHLLTMSEQHNQNFAEAWTDDEITEAPTALCCHIDAIMQAQTALCSRSAIDDDEELHLRSLSMLLDSEQLSTEADPQERRIRILLHENRQLEADLLSWKQTAADLVEENKQLKGALEEVVVAPNKQDLLSEENGRLREELGKFRAEARRVALQGCEAKLQAQADREQVWEQLRESEEECASLTAECEKLRRDLWECHGRASSLAAQLVLESCKTLELQREVEDAKQSSAKILAAKKISELSLLSATAEIEKVHQLVHGKQGCDVESRRDRKRPVFWRQRPRMKC